MLEIKHFGLKWSKNLSEIILVSKKIQIKTKIKENFF
jgi:hypothetical protein